MFTVWNSSQKDPEAIIREIAEAGYRVIEITSYNAEENPGNGINNPAPKRRGLFSKDIAVGFNTFLVALSV